MAMTSCTGLRCRPPLPRWNRSRFGRRKDVFLRLPVSIFIALAVWIVTVGDAAGGPLPDILKMDPKLPWEIKAATVEYDSKNNLYIARDGVVISKGNKRLSADRVQFDHRNMKAFAEGHVVMVTGEDVLSGDRIDIDLENETGTIYQGKVFTKEKHFYIRGERIEKVGKKEYLVYKASVTTCDGPTPAWRITGRNLDITLEGYGTVRHGAFWVKNVPVLYSPYFLFPIKNNRQSGLLTPEIGNSERKGFSYNQPIFWAIGDSSDATFYNDFMSERGDKVGFEYRYVVDDRSKGTVMLDYLDDRKIDDGTGSSGSDYGYEGDGYLRPNHDRYWFRAKANQMLPLDFSSRVDIDIVSDQDYLYEFREGYSGFEATQKYFNQHFGREIEDYTDPIRANSMNLNKTWRYYSFNAEMLWYDNVLNRRWEETDTTLQRLPYVTFNSARQAVTASPLYWDLESQYTYFYRQDGDKGHRADIWPRFSLPHRFREYLFVEPSVGFRETLWQVDREDAGSFSSTDQSLHREMFDARLDLSTYLSRIYTLRPDAEGLLGRLDMRPEKIKHNFRPEIVYEFVPDTDQSVFPFFDPADRMIRKNRTTLYLINSWVSKSKITRAADQATPEQTANPPFTDYNFRQFCRLEISQSYDADTYAPDDPVYLLNLADRTTPEPGEHWSPFYARLDVAPADFYAVTADMEWSHLADDFLSRNIALTLKDRRGDSLYTEYRFTRDFSESFYASVQGQLASWLSTYAEYEQNIADGKNIRSGVGIIYTHPCWSLNMRYLKDRSDYSFGLMVHLAGLGGMGNN